MKRIRALLLTSCGLSACGGPAGDTNVECRALAETTGERPPGWDGTVFTIVMENRSYGDIIGSSHAPYINELAAANAIAAGYHDSYVHPSEPNYIWMVAGENFGILNDKDPRPANTIESDSHLADQIERAGLTWKSYQESMGSPCGLQSHGSYAVKHNPFVYFSNINGWDGSTFQPSTRCDEHIVDYSELDADLASGNVPAYAFITPNLDNDMHNGSIEDGDRWLRRELPKIFESEAFRGGGVLFLLWDEGSRGRDNPPFIAISPNAKPGFVSETDYDTSSYLKTVQTILGLEALPCSPTPEAIATMDDLFAIPLQSDLSTRNSRGTD